MYIPFVEKNTIKYNFVYFNFGYFNNNNNYYLLPNFYSLVYVICKGIVHCRFHIILNGSTPTVYIAMIK